tara:strand:+ start:124 stop:393 length:270 start_codon:yes stop_codon:yes gene_type:complete
MSKINIDEDFRKKIKSDIFKLQDWIMSEKEKGNSVDDIIYNSNKLEKFENFLNEEEYSVFLLTVLNNFKSDDIIESILDAVEKYNDKFN